MESGWKNEETEQVYADRYCCTKARVGFPYLPFRQHVYLSTDCMYIRSLQSLHHNNLDDHLSVEIHHCCCAPLTHTLRCDGDGRGRNEGAARDKREEEGTDALGRTGAKGLCGTTTPLDQREHRRQNNKAQKEIM